MLVNRPLGFFRTFFVRLTSQDVAHKLARKVRNGPWAMRIEIAEPIECVDGPINFKGQVGMFDEAIDNGLTKCIEEGLLPYLEGLRLCGQDIENHIFEVVVGVSCCVIVPYKLQTHYVFLREYTSRKLSILPNREQINLILSH